MEKNIKYIINNNTVDYSITINNKKKYYYYIKVLRFNIQSSINARARAHTMRQYNIEQ